jgi:transposase
VDTHNHEHVAAALNELGELLGELTVAASPAGYRDLVERLKDLGEGALVGIEGAGSYGAGLCKYLQDAGVAVLEVERPCRRDRRTGKPDGGIAGDPSSKVAPATALLHATFPRTPCAYR